MSDKTAKLQVVKNIRPVVSAFSAAAGFMRSISIKRFTPKYRHRELEVIQHNRDSHRTRCQIYCEKGAGNVPTIVLGGLPMVTDGAWQTGWAEQDTAYRSYTGFIDDRESHQIWCSVIH